MYEDINTDIDLIDPTFAQSGFQTAIWLLLSIAAILLVNIIILTHTLYRRLTPWARPRTRRPTAPLSSHSPDPAASTDRTLD